MASKGKGVTRAPTISLFHVPDTILESVYLPRRLNQRISAARAPSDGAGAAQPHYSTPNGNDTAGLTRGFAAARVAKPTCHACGGQEFDGAAEQRAHFKTPTHQANAASKLEWRRLNPGIELAAGEYPWYTADASNADERDWNESDDSLVVGDSGPRSSPRPVQHTAADRDSDPGSGDEANASPFLWFAPAAGEADAECASGPVTAYGVYRRVLVPKGAGDVYVDADQALRELKRMQLPAAPVKTQRELMEEKRALAERRREAAKASAAAKASEDGASGSQADGGLPELDPQSSVWTVVSSNGGFFAAAVFDNRTGNVIAHKTIQRYTTRRKQGGLQSRQDSMAGAANSAGAQIRRHNERRLQEETHELLRRWQPLLAASTSVFVRVPRTARKGFFPPATAGSVQWGDPRIRSVPVTMGRPTLAELQRVYRDLTTVRVAAFDQSQPSTVEPLAATDTAVGAGDESDDGAASDHTLEPEPRPDLIEFLCSTAQMIADAAHTDEQVVTHLCDNLATFLDALGDAAVGLRYLDGVSGVQAHRTPTLLHLASAQGRTELVGFLMDNGEDPTITNGHPPLFAGGMTAYEVAKDRATRDAFRIYRFEHEGEPDGIEWERTRVPAPLSHDQQRANQERAKEKKKKEEDRRKQRAREKTSRRQRAQQAEADDDAALDQAAQDKARQEQQQQAKFSLRNRVGGLSSAELHARTLAMASASWAPQATAPPAVERRPVSPNSQRAIDRELRFQAAERRRLAQQRPAGPATTSTDPCTHCGKPLHGLVPFEQFDWKCCSIECLHEHQAQHGA
ncbi:hypothetical protein H4R19_000535 [Coemansia spiralis]|nr:hypothetical protein H4R19_000535 [Coemansia spiralis]